MNYNLLKSREKQQQGYFSVNRRKPGASKSLLCYTKIIERGNVSMALIEQDSPVTDKPGIMDRFLSRFRLSKKWVRHPGLTELEALLQKKEFTLRDTILYQYYVKKRSDAITIYNEALAKWKEAWARFK